MATDTERGENEKAGRFFDLLEPVAITYLYILSVLAPYIGLVLGIVLIKKGVLEESRRLGKNCTLISSIMLGLMLVCVIAYMFFYAFLILGIFGYAMGRPPAGY